MSEPFFELGDATLYVGDALDVLPNFGSGSVDAIVTSPPYGDLRASGGPPPDDYADWFEPILRELLRVVGPEGSMMLNLGRIMRGGEEHPYIDETKARARAVGWRHVDTIVWFKPNGMPYGSHAFLTGQHEFVLWLAPSRHCYRGYDDASVRARTPGRVNTRGRKNDRGEREGAYEDRHLDARRGGERATPERIRPGTVYVEGVGGANRGVLHNAPMPVRLARHLTRLTAPRGALVLDPFAGSGTTLLAALQLGRRAVGVELHAEHALEANSRLAPLLARA